jgi:hypothetical protein
MNTILRDPGFAPFGKPAAAGKLRAGFAQDGFRGNDKLWYVPIKTTLIWVFGLKTVSLNK